MSERVKKLIEDVAKLDADLVDINTQLRDVLVWITHSGHLHEHLTELSVLNVSAHMTMWRLDHLKELLKLAESITLLIPPCHGSATAAPPAPPGGGLKPGGGRVDPPPVLS
jgi:hypothetical protein